MADEDYNRPYVGYRPVRRPEAQNDRIASANAPLSALRGYIAGTLGLPGNLEGLGRMLIPAAGAKPYLPNSEYFQNVLPLRSLQETPTGRVFTEVGDLFGGAGLATGAKVVGSGAKALGRAGERYAERVVPQILERGGLGADLLQGLAQGTRSNVVKPKGGNWLAGQSERITGPVKKKPTPMDKFAIREAMTDADRGRYFAAADAPGVTGLESQLKAAGLYDKYVTPPDAVNTWIDKKLGNYVRNEMATPEDPLRAMAEKWATEKPELLAQADAKLAGLNAKTQELAAQRGVPEEWLTSHRRDVLAAEKARDLIEARHALHIDTAPAHGGGRWEPETLAGKRKNYGFPAEGMGVSEPAKAWEQFADEAVGVGPAGARFGENFGGQALVDNPWLAKVPPETPTYTGYGLNDLGFGHLTDELRNALDPNSGLPAELLMKYADLPKKTVPDVVSRVADINAWRAAQKAEADLTKANNVAVVPFKEYPEQGLAWKEFKTPEVKSVDELGPEQKSWYDDYVAGGVSPEGALKRVSGMGENKNILRDALKYEGDTLQHCVGGANYCEAVKAGESKIYSLRDARGKPHATIQVKMPEISRDIRDYPGLSEDEYKMLRQENSGSNATRSPMKDYLETHLGSKRAREVLSSYAEVDPLPIIAQIKGLRNGPPEAKYLPQIQDFIKSGNWSEVKDLQNTGLIRHPDTGEFVTGASRRQEVLDEIAREALPPEPGFAAGGAVNAGNEANLYDETKIQSLVDSLNKEMTNGY